MLQFNYIDPNTTLTVNGAYAFISKAFMGVDRTLVDVEIQLINGGTAPTFNSPFHTFYQVSIPYNQTLTTTIIAQAYTYLKTLPIFDGATDYIITES